MKKKIILNLVMFFTFFTFVLYVSSLSASEKNKIGYIEAGEYYSYTETFKAIKNYLKEKGWADKVEYPAELNASPGWDNKKALDDKAKFLMEKKDIAVIIAAGSDATKALLKYNNNKTPIIGIAIADPVKSKIVVSEKDAGVDNFTTRIIPERYKKMFRIFHDVVRFKKLGLLYDTTENSKTFSNVDDAHEVSKEKGFQIVEYNKISAINKTEECITGIKTLIVQGIDAFFLPPLVCFDWKLSDVKKIIDELIKNKIPVFAREGTRDVKAGALMGFTSFDFIQRGEFHGNQLIKIIQGEKPRSLTMVDQITPKISLNIFVAKEIGFDPPFDIMGASDEIFQEITLPDERLVK